MTGNKLVHIKIISANGHDDWNGTATDALSKIMEEVGNGRSVELRRL